MRPALAAIVEVLLARSEDARRVTLDEIGEAFGAELASPDDIEVVLDALEASGREVASAPTVDATARLRLVLVSARALAIRTGRKPTPAEIAQEAGLDVRDVHAALLLGRVMGR